jgi:hypothetical protein
MRHMPEATSKEVGDSSSLLFCPHSFTAALLQSDKQRQQRYSQSKHLSTGAGQAPRVPATVSSPTSATNPHSRPNPAIAPPPPAPTPPGVGTSPQSLEDYIRFSMLVSLSQQHDAIAGQTPLAAPLPPPTDADNRFIAHGPSFGPHEGLLLSSGAPGAGLVPLGVPSRGNGALPPAATSSPNMTSQTPPATPTGI